MYPLSIAGTILTAILLLFEIGNGSDNDMTNMLLIAIMLVWAVFTVDAIHGEHKAKKEMLRQQETIAELIGELRYLDCKHEEVEVPKYLKKDFNYFYKEDKNDRQKPN